MPRVRLSAREQEAARARRRVQQAELMRRRRENPELRLHERSRNTEARRLARLDDEHRHHEQSKNTEAHRLAREDDERRLEERSRDRAAHRLARQGEGRRLEEQSRNTEARQAEREAQIHGESWDEVILRFEAACRQGPTHVCNCCGGLWFESSMKKLTRHNFLGRPYDYLDKVFCVNSQEGEYCHTCRSALRSGRIPRLALSNGLNFPAIPPEVALLTRLEQRLVSPRHVFQAIWSVHGHQGQLRTKGRIVNVPVSVDTTVQSLPRLPSDDAVLHVRLARQIKVARNYCAGNIRPQRVMQAAAVLANSPLYCELGITISHNWITDLQQQEAHLADIDLNDSWMDVEENTEEGDIHNIAIETEALEVNAGDSETALTSDEGLRMAPAEGNRPVSVLMDENSPYLAFPSLFGGHKLAPFSGGIALKRSEVYKSFARNHDRRAAEAVDFLLFMAKTLEIEKLTSNRNIHLRKRKRNGETINATAGNVLDVAFIDGLIFDDNAYCVFQGVRNAGHHWRTEGMKVKAMIRTFGIATLFVTVSAAELKWNELIVILKKVLDGESITEDQAECLTKNEKAILIQRDPVTCARYFENRFKALFSTFRSCHGPFGDREILHFYERVEFQHRGSPHVHMMLWLSDAPIYDKNNEASHTEVTHFIDEIISCSSDYADDDPLKSLLTLQTHRHTHTCRKKNYTGVKCRFGIPFFPMESTVILHPYEEERDDIKTLKEVHKRIREYLEVETIDSNITFDRFLEAIQCDRELYILAIRTSLRKPCVFLKRRPCDVYINNYNEKILRLQRSNMDIQFVLDPYACCSYIVDYINKSDRGLSELLQKVLEDVRRGNGALKDCLHALGAAHNLNSELSAQEAAYTVLQLPMSLSSEKCVFIHTGPPSQRSRMLKSSKELTALDRDDRNIFAASPLDHYSHRPDSLDALNLAQFSAWYEYSRTKKRATRETENDDDEQEVDEFDGTFYKLKDGSGYIRKRKFPKVIRFVRFNKEKQREQYYRELVMLYKPWRNEAEECGEEKDCELIVKDNLDLITLNRKEFNFYEDVILDAAMNEAMEKDREVEEEEDRNRPTPDELADYHLEDPQGVNNVDFGTYEPRPFAERFKPPGRIPDEEFENLLSSLNNEQRDLVTHVLNHMKRSPDEALYIYLKGGAGVGKSHVIRTLYQCLLRLFHSAVNANPDKISVLLLAPTGKAAFNIEGSTIHTGLQLPVNQREATKLSADVANTMAVTYSELKVVIIDEISMVGTHIFEQMDKRLRDMKDENKPFGGLSVIAVGDFHQLRPVEATSLIHGTMSSPIQMIFNRPLWHYFQVHCLTTIMRQREDGTFAAALNNMASGTMTDEDEALFKSRCFQNLPEELHCRRPVHLFHSNKSVTHYNVTVLQQMPGESADCEASDGACGDGGQSALERALGRLKELPLTKTMGLPRKLYLKIGGRYMMTTNVDCADGLVNGVIGILKKIDYGVSYVNPNNRKPLRLWVEFEGERCGRDRRVRHQTLMQNLGLTSQWTPVEMVTLEIPHRSNNIKLTRKQFPLVPAEAITIHKSQGSTYECVVVHLEHSIERALMYVACSRVTKASGLFILGDFRKTNPITPNSPLQQELLRHAAMRLQPSFIHLRHREDTAIQVIFHNAQSLHKHWKVYSSDDVFCLSDILLFAETWTLPSDTYIIGDHVQVASVDCVDIRRPIGCRAYVRPAILEHVTCTSTRLNSDKYGSCSITGFTFARTNILAVYCSPGCRWDTVLTSLRHVLTDLNGERTVIAGDFNVNFAEDNLASERAKAALLKLGLTIQTPSICTTRYGTQIDAILATFGLKDAGTYTSLTSYHEPLWGWFFPGCPRHQQAAFSVKRRSHDTASSNSVLFQAPAPSPSPSLALSFASDLSLPPLPHLADEDRRDILNQRWLSDDVMVLAQEIVRRARPETRGLYSCAGAFTLDPLDPADDTLFLQIINRSTPFSLASLADYLHPAGTHWLLATNFGAGRNCLQLYDSMFTSESPSTAELTRHLLSRSSKPCVTFPRVQQQHDSYSCGIYAIAFAFSIAVGEDPASRLYHSDRMAPHLLECLEQGRLKPFPSRGVGGLQQW